MFLRGRGKPHSAYAPLALNQRVRGSSPWRRTQSPGFAGVRAARPLPPGIAGIDWYTSRRACAPATRTDADRDERCAHRARRSAPVGAFCASRSDRGRPRLEGRDAVTNPVIGLERPLIEREVGDLLSVSMNALKHWRWVGKGPRYVQIDREVGYRPATCANGSTRRSLTRAEHLDRDSPLTTTRAYANGNRPRHVRADAERTVARRWRRPWPRPHGQLAGAGGHRPTALASVDLS